MRSRFCELFDSDCVEKSTYSGRSDSKQCFSGWFGNQTESIVAVENVVVIVLVGWFSICATEIDAQLRH